MDSEVHAADADCRGGELGAAVRIGDEANTGTLFNEASS